MRAGSRARAVQVNTQLFLLALALLLLLVACAQQAGERSPSPGSPPATAGQTSPKQAGMFRDALASMAPGIAPSAPQPMPGDIDREKYPDKPSNPVKIAAEEPVSTFSIDVDTTSYGVVRRYLNDGTLPPRDAVRIEELLNYFDYDYKLPEKRDAPFSTSVFLYEAPWNSGTQLLHIGIKGYDIVQAERPKANLVFLIDVSGSMDNPAKLPLVKKSLRLLVDELKPTDSVAIVVYAGNAGTLLEPTLGRDKAKILAAIDDLSAGGSTAGGEGIRRAYSLAEASFDKAAVNRVILATDGDFNVGIADPDRLEGFISEKRKTGIYLTCLGYGAGNYNDVIMQKLAQAGNGNAAYIDTLKEARKVLVTEMSSTLFPIAKDVKIQVEFNPAYVTEYRLIGYETRLLKREDFNNDTVDAGDIGSGHAVTALYEIVPVGSKARLTDPLRYGKAGAAAPPKTAGEIAFLRLRYKLPDSDTSKLIERPIRSNELVAAQSLAPEPRFAAAVAAFGQRLKGEPYLKDFDFDAILKLADGAKGKDRFGIRAEFVDLVRAAKSAPPLPALEPPASPGAQ
jgi:Ca-activated chloride channel family protein